MAIRLLSLDSKENLQHIRDKKSRQVQIPNGVNFWREKRKLNQVSPLFSGVIHLTLALQILTCKFHYIITFLWI